MPLKSPLTDRERRLLNAVEPTLSANPPGIDLPSVLERFATDVQAEIDAAGGGGGGLNIVADLEATNTFVTDAAAPQVMVGGGGDDDMEYLVPVDGDGDYLLLWSGNIRSTDPGRQAIVSLAKNGASVNGSNREHSLDDFVGVASQAVFVGCLAGDTLSARLRRSTGGGPAFDVECSARSLIVIKVS